MPNRDCWTNQPFDKANPNQPDVTSLCGRSLSRYFIASEPKRIGCSECGNLYWAAERAKREGYGAEKVLLSSKAKYSDDSHPYQVWGVDTRSLWKVQRNGEHIAWVYLNQGWGKGWSLVMHGLRRHVKEADAKVEDVTPGFQLSDRAFKFRDQAVCWIADEIAAYHAGRGGIEPRQVVTPAAYVAEIRKREERNRMQAAERLREEAQHKKEREEHKRREEAARAEATDQLRELHARADLTNYQRAGLEWALAKLGITFGVDA